MTTIVENTPRTAHRKAFRLDLRRAALALFGVVAALMLAFLIVREDQPAAQAGGFGRDSRVGAILMLPLVGDDCRQFAFDNDNGTLSEGKPEPCSVILERWQKTLKKSSHVEAVSENFRR
jgi:hypothetical protein